MQRRRCSRDDLDLGLRPEEPDWCTPPLRSSEHAWGLLVGRSWREHSTGHRTQAMLTAARALLMRPYRIASWRNLGALVVKKPAQNGVE